MNVYSKLLTVQQKLKSPKNQFNSFGKYNYRSCEDILEGLKPCLDEVKAVVIISDEVIFIEGRFYIKATVRFIDSETEQLIENCAYAREEAEKKGQDSAQVTGSVSSYARKYALNGLFCIDDTKDSDATNKHDDKPGPSATTNKTSRQNNNSTKADGTCSGCSNTINQAVKAFSEKQFGKALCMTCQKKQQQGAK